MVAEPEIAIEQALDHNSPPVQLEKRPNRRKISNQEAKAIAKLQSDYFLTETEACARLDIDARQWFNWKQRNKKSEQYRSMFEKARQASIVHNVQNIRDVSNGIGVKQMDWRASQFLLQVTDRERFGTERKDNSAQPAQAINVTVMVDSLKRVLPQPEPVKQLVDVPAVKSLPEST